MKTPKERTVWIAKDCLNKKGIYQVTVRPAYGWENFWVAMDGLNCYYDVQCFDTKADAIKKAEQIKAKRIASMEKQLAKIKAITFAP